MSSPINVKPLQVKKLSCVLDNTTLLKNINFDLVPGEWLMVTGPNGAGKSTLLKTIAQDVPVSSGQIDFFGRLMPDWPALDRAKQLAYLPQSSSLNFPYRLEEVVALGRSPHDTGKKMDEALAEASMAALDIIAMRDRLYTELSGGEKQRTHIARVLCQIWDRDKEAVLLLDEPLSALDLQHQQMLLLLLKRKKSEGLSILMTVHDLNIALRFADRVLVLDESKLVAQGPPSQILNEQLLKTVFHVDSVFHQEKDQSGQLKPWISVL